MTGIHPRRSASIVCVVANVFGIAPSKWLLMWWSVGFCCDRSHASGDVYGCPDNPGATVLRQHGTFTIEPGGSDREHRGRCRVGIVATERLPRPGSGLTGVREVHEAGLQIGVRHRHIRRDQRLDRGRRRVDIRVVVVALPSNAQPPLACCVLRRYVTVLGATAPLTKRFAIAPYAVVFNAPTA